MTNQIIILALTILIFNCCQKEAPLKEVLFVCTHGAARSPIATAYFNRLAEEKKLNYRAIFRGTEPAKVLTPETISGLTKDGFSIGTWLPKKVTKQDVKKVYRAITFDCILPTTERETNIENWSDIPSISEDYDKARDAIKEKVEGLVGVLEK